MRIQGKNSEQEIAGEKFLLLRVMLGEMFLGMQEMAIIMRKELQAKGYNFLELEKEEVMNEIKGAEELKKLVAEMETVQGYLAMMCPRNRRKELTNLDFNSELFLESK